MLQTKYNTLIKKIRRNRRLVILFTLIAIIATVILASPMEWIAGDEVILARKGLPTVVIVLLVLFWLIVELFAYAAVSLPLTASLDEECDPEKHLILNAALNSNSSSPEEKTVSQAQSSSSGS